MTEAVLVERRPSINEDIDLRIALWVKAYGPTITPHCLYVGASQRNRLRETYGHLPDRYHYGSRETTSLYLVSVAKADYLNLGP